MASEPAAMIDIGQFLDEGRWSPFQKWVLFLAALAFAMNGFADPALGLAIPALAHAWHVRADAFAAVVAPGLIGVATGAAAGGILGDRYGRRWALITSVLLLGAMTAVSAALNSVLLLALVRVFEGLGVGAILPNGAALIAEFTPLRRRSLAIAAGMVFIPVGGVLAGLVGAYVLPHFGWRALFLTCGLPAVAAGALLVVALPESPRFLLRRPDRRTELIRLLRRFGLSGEGALVDEPAHEAASPMSALFGATVRRDTIALCVGFFCCFLASYTIFSWVPTMLARRGFGLGATSFGLMAFNFGGLTGGVLGGWLIQQFGSRTSTIGLAAAAIAGSLVLGLIPINPTTLFWPTIAALAALGLFIAGLYNGLYVLAAHVYPHAIRATGVGVATAAGGVGAVTSAYAGVISLELAGAAGYFALVALTIAVLLAAVALIRQHVPHSRRAQAPAQSHS